MFVGVSESNRTTSVFVDFSVSSNKRSLKDHNARSCLNYFDADVFKKCPNTPLLFETEIVLWGKMELVLCRQEGYTTCIYKYIHTPTHIYTGGYYFWIILEWSLQLFLTSGVVYAVSLDGDILNFPSSPLLKLELLSWAKLFSGPATILQWICFVVVVLEISHPRMICLPILIKKPEGRMRNLSSL